MLVVTRLPVGSIVIGDAVEVKVLEVLGDLVRFQIVNPGVVPARCEKFRLADELISLNGGISVKTVRVEGSKVRLGITVPQGVVVCRKEIVWKSKPLEHQ